VRRGLAQVAASVGGWRFDTTDLRVGSQPVILLQGGAAGFDGWRPLGDPQPRLVTAPIRGLVLNADREWDSGVLSRATVPLLPGLSVTATLASFGDDMPDAGATFSVALVAPEGPGALDRDAPQFLKYASIMWNADARRLVYSVGREVFAEVVDARFRGALTAAIIVEPDSTARFEVDGRLRWRSSLRVLSSNSDARVHAWIGAHGTGHSLILREVRVLLAGDSLSSR
jgi:hypothetical protein